MALDLDAVGKKFRISAEPCPLSGSLRRDVVVEWSCRRTTFTLFSISNNVVKSKSPNSSYIADGKHSLQSEPGQPHIITRTSKLICREAIGQCSPFCLQYSIHDGWIACNPLSLPSLCFKNDASSVSYNMKMKMNHFCAGLGTGEVADGPELSTRLQAVYPNSTL